MIAEKAISGNRELRYCDNNNATGRVLGCPDALAAAHEAFGLGWAEIEAVEGSYDLQLAHSARRAYSQAAIFGECDPERLRAYALAGFKP